MILQRLTDQSVGIGVRDQAGEFLLNKLLALVAESKRKVFLELQALDSDMLVWMAGKVVNQLQGRTYHISIGHQIEITSARFVINTTGLSATHVCSLLDLIRLPGHY